MNQGDDQIDGLLSDFHSAVVQPGRRVVLIPVPQMDGSTMELRVQISPSFPAQPPTVLLSSGPGYVHSWLDGDQRVVGCPSIRDWNQSKSTLRVTLAEIVQEFFLNPPTRVQPPPVQQAQRQEPPPPPVRTQQPPARRPSASTGEGQLDGLLAELQELTPSELDRLARDDTDVGLQKLLQAHPTILACQSERGQLQSESEALAGKILALSQALATDRKECEEVRTEYERLHASVSEKSQQQQARLQEDSPEAVLQLLNQLKRDEEAITDGMVEQLHSKQLMATDFVSQFVEQRKRYHRVAIFHERLQVQPAAQQPLPAPPMTSMPPQSQQW